MITENQGVLRFGAISGFEEVLYPFLPRRVLGNQVPRRVSRPLDTPPKKNVLL